MKTKSLLIWLTLYILFQTSFFIFGAETFDFENISDNVHSGFNLEPGTELNIQIDSSTHIRPVNKQISGISFHKVSGWAGYPYNSNGDYALTPEAEIMLKDLRLPVTRFYALGDENYPEADPSIMIAPSLEPAIDRVSALAKNIGIPESTIVLELENQGARTMLPVEVWERIVTYSLMKGYNFRHWEISNEPHRDGTVFATQEEYVNHIKEVSTAIKALQPEAKIIIASRRDHEEWGKEIIVKASGYYDYVAPHFYSWIDEDFEETVLGENAEMINRIKNYQSFLVSQNPGRVVGIFDTEWGLSTWTPDGLRPEYNYRNANILGTVFRAVRMIYYQTDNLVTAASGWEMFVRPLKPGFCTFADGEPLQRGMLYWLYYYLNRHLGDWLVAGQGTAPFYTIQRIATQTGNSVPETPVLISVSDDDQTVYAILVNASWTNSCPGTLEVLNKNILNASGVFLSNSDLNATPIVENEEEFVYSLPVQTSNSTLTFMLPPHSVSFISMNIQEIGEQIISVDPAKPSFKTGEDIAIKIVLSGQGDGTLKLFIDDSEDPVSYQIVSLNGIQEHDVMLPPIEFIGSYNLKAVLEIQETNEKNISLNITDGKAPYTTSSITGPLHTAGDLTYLAENSRIIFNSIDESSGVERTEYRTEGNIEWRIYEVPLNPKEISQVSTQMNIYARAIDKNGNIEDAKQFTYNLDFNSPTTVLSFNESSEFYEITLDATDEGCGVGGTFFVLDEQPVQTGNVLTIDKTGKHTLNYWSIDWLGNAEVPQLSVFETDMEPPFTNHDYTTGNIWNTSDVTILLNASDNLSGVKTTYYRIDDGAQETGTTIFISEEGTHTLLFWSEDNAGNQETEQEITVKIDKSFPIITVTSPIEGQTFNIGDEISITYQVTDDISGLGETEAFINGTNEITGQATYIAQSNDSYLLVISTDVAGNSTENRINFKVISNGIPPEFFLEPGVDLNLVIDPLQNISPTNKNISGISFHRVSGWTGYPYNYGGEYSLTLDTENMIKELMLPVTRFYALADEDYPEADSSAGIAPSLEPAIDRVAYLARNIGIPEDAIVLELENQASQTILPVEVWERAVNYSLTKGYKFQYWEIGNDPDRADSVFETPADYVSHVKDVSSAIRALQPEAKIIIACRRDEQEWGKDILSQASGYYDFVAPHWYSSIDDDFEETVLGENAEMINRIKNFNDYLINQNPGRIIGQFDTEWGLATKTSDGLGPERNVKNANIQGTIFRAIRMIYYETENLITAASGWEMFSRATKAGFCTFASGQPMQRGMLYWLYYYFNRYLGDWRVAGKGTAPFYTIQRAPTQAGNIVPETPALITTSEDGQTLYAILVNASWTDSCPGTLKVLNKAISNANGIFLSSDDLNASPIINSDEFVHQLPVQTKDSDLTFILPPHSVCFISMSISDTSEEIISVEAAKPFFVAGEDINVKILISGNGNGSLKLFIDENENPALERTVSLNGIQELHLTIPPIPLAGTYNLRTVFEITDKKGKTIALNIIEADLEPPITNHDYTNADKWNTANVTVTLTSSDNSSGIKASYYQVDDKAQETGSSIFISEDGIHTVLFWAEDNAGNQETKQQLTVKIDKSLPVISVTSPIEGETFETDDEIFIQYQAIDTVSGIKETKAFVNGIIEITGQSTYIVQSNDSYLLVVATDLAGNSAEKTVNFKIEGEDRTPPMTTSNYTQSEIWTQENVSILLTTTDDESGVKNTYYQIDSNSIQTGSSFTVSNEGNHQVCFWSEDNAGNKEPKNTIAVKIDRSRPQLTVSSPIENGTYHLGQIIPITYLAIDDHSGVERVIIVRNGNQDITDQTSINAKYTDAYLFFRVIDKAGNRMDKKVYYRVRD